MTSQLKHWLTTRQPPLCHRQLLVISGEKDWARDIAYTTFVQPKQSSVLWIGDHPSEVAKIQVKNYRTELGREYDHVIFDAFDGFRANAAMALSGTIRSGGLMILLCPELNEWKHYLDPEHINRVSFGYRADDLYSHFYHYLGQMIKKDDSVAMLSKQEFISPSPAIHANITAPSFHQQNQAVEAICKVATGHNHRPLILSADRGRGKSSALGIAAAKLLQTTTKKILVTAPLLSTTEQLFHHAKRLLPKYQKVKNQLSFNDSSLQFVALDKLLASEEQADLLLIDEAAAIPVNMLLSLSKKFSRIVFCTTIHGYEGSGRGFEFRFKKD
ncbi:tRNA(Met) cytidine acetyltransferase TmcA domain-containing protein [Paraglaciecola aquimarina]|uniref:tRNA(Met) cytidine acetyltransferase TmcA domain-containing protein n=1 Tax=Paraglaciecola aquimarina TaxID=1235557 RepID=A0ABU3SZZ8_9ALTE|nr:tRNA(Met) cytidine acetyltransferase TmcA domain-containing protein [Paraglaciecola aquimarina]MDU0355591.1 tRNA(Met) cytidine acetyltransferase TmcA domain-containing protein [Paraglaciecola aquimarina]